MAGRLCNFEFIHGALVDGDESTPKGLGGVEDCFPEGATVVGCYWKDEIGWGRYLGVWLSWNVTILCDVFLTENDWRARGVQIGERLGMRIADTGGGWHRIAAAGGEAESLLVWDNGIVGKSKRCLCTGWIGSLEGLVEESIPTRVE
jgi:hypothetical protein